ncbi:MAG: hypothetical protein J7J86_01565 [Bacteroidales bacterium]|nr:hypothetical protein [Bacteroidales bacterium]
MKKVLQLTLIAVIITFISCEKEEQILQKEVGTEISNSTEQSDGKFKKEIIVTDESGKNQAFYVIYSDDENLLSEYLMANELSLKINEDDIEMLKLSDLSNQKQIKSSNGNFDLNQEPKIIVELITTNLQDDVVSYSLEVKNSQLKSTKDFIFGYPVGYTTSNNFIGAVHNDKGYDLVAKLRYKSTWLSSWKYLTVNGANAWFLSTPSGYYCYYCSLDEYYSFYKRGIVIYPQLYQQSINYHIAYSHNDFRGVNCKIGNFDHNNYGECYVGTSPVGTNAFVWGPNSNNLNFYYTPVNGNQCQRPGSWFDGANCFVMDIPAGCEPYTWQRNWLVKSDKLN